MYQTNAGGGVQGAQRTIVETSAQTARGDLRLRHTFQCFSAYENAEARVGATACACSFHFGISLQNYNAKNEKYNNGIHYPLKRDSLSRIVIPVTPISIS